MTIQQVEAPMTGTVQRVLVEIGAAVQVGQTLAVIESMKMEIPVCSPATGRIESVRVKEGQSVEEGETVITLTLG